MPDLLALDVAILPPPDVCDRAIRLSAALPDADRERLRLDDEHLPHITLTQQFVEVDDLDRTFERLDEVLHDVSPLTIRITGAGKSAANTVWLAIERTEPLTSLHEHLMEALAEFERGAGGAPAFVGGKARAADVEGVTQYRLKSSFFSYAPHITLGHADELPRIEPSTFEATIVAACHLGTFCTCRRVLRQWELIRSA
jgi:2'-5' RNA ligase